MIISLALDRGAIRNFGFSKGWKQEASTEGMSNKQGHKVTLSTPGGGMSSGGGGAERAVPDDKDLESEAEDMSEDAPSPKRGREASSDEKRRRRGRAATAVEPTSVLDLGHMERLLEQHAERIMKAQRENLNGMMQLFEQQTNARIEGVEAKTDSVDKRVQAVEEKMSHMQEQLQQALRPDRPRPIAEHDRRLTLVYGGWERETRKGVILQQLSEAIDQLNLRDFVDQPPFCTGPRRSTAMSNFVIRDGENEYMVRKRMHEIILGLANGAVQIPNSGKRMFATYSKTRSERAVANHAGWIKRTMTSFGSQHAELLDVEYSTGSCWLGDSLVSSATRPLPAEARREGSS